MLDYLSAILGWTGSISLVLAYWLSSQGRLSVTSLTYQLMNIFGSLMLLFNNLYHGAYPSSGVNAIWLIVGTFHLIK